MSDGTRLGKLVSGLPGCNKKRTYEQKHVCTRCGEPNLEAVVFFSDGTKMCRPCFDSRYLKEESEPTTADSDESDKCPKCGSGNISGLMQAFWVPLTDGEFVGEWKELQSETEIGEERLCRDCEHEFVFGDEVPE